MFMFSIAYLISLQDKAGKSSCLKCWMGSARNSSGATSCTPCAEGSFSNADGNMDCTPCPKGSFQVPAAAANISPPAMICLSFITDSLFGTDFIMLAFIHDQDREGQVACEPCAVATFAARPGSPRCMPCNPLALSSLHPSCLAPGSEQSCEETARLTEPNGTCRCASVGLFKFFYSQTL